MEKFFKIKERGSTLKTEIFAGITTFFAMAYIIFVNPNQVAAEGANGWLVGLGADPGTMGQIWNSVYIASIIVAVIGTLLMAFVADMPFAQACGMGLNSFFCTIFVAGSFFAGEDVTTGYQAGLVIVFLSGIVFLILSVTGLRKYIAVSMPECLKKAIPAGIGLFIAMIGFKNAGIIEDNQYTFVQFYDFHGRIKQIGTEVDGVMVTGLDVWHQIVPVVVALLGVLIIAILAKKGVKSNVIIGILASAVLYYLFMWEVPSFDMSNISQSFKDFANVGFLGLFNGDAWDAAFNSSYVGGVFSGIMLIVAFCLVDMFDTIGTIYGTAASANMMDENGDPIKAMAPGESYTFQVRAVRTYTVDTDGKKVTKTVEGDWSAPSAAFTIDALQPITDLQYVKADDNYYYFNDPDHSGEAIGYEKELVRQRYEQLGEQAIIISR